VKTLSLLVAATASALLLAVQPAQAVHPRPSSRSVPVTQLTLKIKDCEGCEVGLASYLQGSMDVWQSKPQEVSNGAVTFAVPASRTTGLSITVRAPWEGATGHVTNVVLRYKGVHVGTKVGFDQARKFRRAGGCWAGTSDSAITFRVKVREVQVQGEAGKVPGTLAWVPVTQDWLRPLVPAWHGVIGTQDVMPCKAP
jgi:hypothetical protein